MDVPSPTPPIDPDVDPTVAEALAMSEDPADPAAAPVEPDSTLMQWQLEEPPAEKRPTFWYIALGLISAGIILIAILTRTWLFIPLGVLVPVALSMYGNKRGGQHSYSLTTSHVVTDTKAHIYDEFKAFFVVEDKGQAIFELIPIKRFGTLVTLHCPQNLMDDIVEILASVLPETEPQGYLGESVFKRLRF